MSDLMFMNLPIPTFASIIISNCGGEQRIYRQENGQDNHDGEIGGFLLTLDFATNALREYIQLVRRVTIMHGKRIHSKP